MDRVDSSGDASAGVRSAVVTAVNGEHDFLIGHIGGISLGSRPPDLHVIVAMADPALSRGKVPVASDRWRTVVRTVRTDLRRPLPVAAARNLAASTAIKAGAQMLIFLDVDLIPGPRLLQTVLQRAAEDRHQGPVLWCGEVRQLPPPDSGQDVRHLEQLAAKAPNPPLLMSHHEQALTALPDRGHGVGGMAISASDFERVGGFTVGDSPEPRALDARLAAAVIREGGTVVHLGGAPAYRQARVRMSGALADLAT